MEKVARGKSLSFRRLVSYRWIVRNTGFFLYVAFLLVLYIANGHWADRTVRETTRTMREVKDLEYEYKTLKAEMMFKSRETEVTRVAAPLGLKMPESPPPRLLLKRDMTKEP